MKPLFVALVVAFNLSVVVLYSRGLTSGAPSKKGAISAPVAERSASTAYTTAVVESVPAASAEGSPVEEASGSGAKAVVPEHKGAVALEPVLAPDGKEIIDAKDGKELQPVAVEDRPLALRMPLNRPSRETLPAASGGILAPPNRANLDPPIVSPEAR